jgi:hypothetical protein
MLERLRPWSLRVAAVLRVVVVAAVGARLYNGGTLGLILGGLFLGCAVGLWFRRAWPWVVALVLDIVLVVYYAVTLVESPDVSLFTVVAVGAVADIMLLSFGQATLAPGGPPPP